MILFSKYRIGPVVTQIMRWYLVKFAPPEALMSARMLSGSLRGSCL